MRLKLKKLVIFIFVILLGFVVMHKLLIEPFATEVWQSSRVARPTRNMSYDLRGQPLSAQFDPNISPWNISTLPVGMAQPPTTPFLTKQQFETNSIGLSLPEQTTIEHGYLAGWPEMGADPGVWINPALLNQDKRWGFYKFDNVGDTAVAT